MERNLHQQTAWQGCPWWGGELAIRGHGLVLPSGLGEAGELCMSGRPDEASLAVVEQE